MLTKVKIGKIAANIELKTLKKFYLKAVFFYYYTYSILFYLCGKYKYKEIRIDV